jgi:site-specific recombinase XerD
VDDVDELHARKYFLHLIEEKNSSASLTRVHRFALELFLFGVHGRVVDLSFARGIKRETRVPSVLNKKEIEALLSNVNNHKHRAMIALIYSAGLRISEVLKLRVRDVDCDSLTLHLRQAKGKKDRITVFSEKLLPDLKIFLKGKEPNDYVFPSQAVGKNGKPKPLSARALQAVFQRCLVRAGIQKRVTPHDLRHTFATHLLENGIGIRHIQSLLGHRHISTTAIYTKVANPKISGIKSPY